MTVMQDMPSSTTMELETPFAESFPASAEGTGAALGLLPWTEAASPFAETLGSQAGSDSQESQIVAEAFETLRDEAFDGALAELIAETSEAADARLQGEQPMQLSEQRWQLADAHLAPIRFEAEQCVQRFIDHVANLDPAALAPGELQEVLDRFDPGPSSVSPAGEEFLGGLLRKAKSVVKSVAHAAGTVARAALPILGPILNQLKQLIRPLLQRVLQIAINKLPVGLHEPALMLARRFGLAEAESPVGSELEAEDELVGEGFAASPVTVVDPQTLAESLDAALAESVLGGETLEQGESFGHDPDRGAEPQAGNQLEALAEARGAFMNTLQAAADNQDVQPAVEQFIPAILPALRLGLYLVGRPKVVSFLAGYLAKMIGQWVGPTLSQPLSSAIVDVGLRLIGLEQGPPGKLDAETVPATLAATVEDTVRRLSEQPEHVLEDEGLLQAAVSEAFEQAVAANFPATMVRPDLRIAPSLGGTFVTLHPRSPYAYKTFSRVPEIELSTAQASGLRTFRGVTVDAALRALGLALPAKFRVHIFEAGPGTTLPRLARLERISRADLRGYRHLHPLTVANAAALLREPRLGVDVPDRFLESRHRIAVGQRFFFLEPIGQSPTPAPPSSRRAGACDATHPSDSRMWISLRRGEGRLALYFSEADAQKLAADLAGKPTSTAFLRALVRAVRSATAAIGRSDGTVQIPREVEFEPSSEQLVRHDQRHDQRHDYRHDQRHDYRHDQRYDYRHDQRLEHRRDHRSRHVPPALRARLRRHILAAASTAVSHWARTHGQEFVRAAQHPGCGVTVRIHVRGLPIEVAGAFHGGRSAAAAATTVTVAPGRSRP
jgi:hypothetical protein